MPLLWLCGPAGVGKSTVSWQLFTELTRAGIPAGFADTDQLCMCYPAPPRDPGRQRIKTQNLGAMIGNYRAAGARCMIVNGVVDPVAGVQRDLLPNAAITVCRLRADRHEVVRRFARRHGPGNDLDELLSEILAEADGLDASDFADACVDTTGVLVGEVARLVRDSCRDWHGFHGTALTHRAASADPGTGAGDDTEPSRGTDGADGHIVLICGPAGVGKSTIGFELYLRYLDAGLTAGYVDLEQVGFAVPAAADDPGHHRLKARNLAAIWQTYHAAGARHLIATGRVADEAAFQVYVGAMPAATITLCRLHAGPAELTRRILSRGNGGSWPQPGDPLRGRQADYLHAVAEQAIADAEGLERAHVGTLRINTDGRTIAEAASLIAGMTEWPGMAADPAD